MKIDKLTEIGLHEARAAWIGIATDLDMPSSHYDRVLSWAEKNIDYGAPLNNGLAYGFFDDNHSLLAIIEIIYTKVSNASIGWLKMMNIELSPEFSPVAIELEPSKYQKLLDIYLISIVQVVALTATHSARVVKLYGRNQQLLQLLFAIKKAFTDKPTNNYAVEMNGRWLVISQK